MRLVHHYRKHINDETLQKEKGKKIVEKISKQVSSERLSKKYIFDEKSNKYRCLICSKLFKFLGTGIHWYRHARRGETALPGKNNYL